MYSCHSGAITVSANNAAQYKRPEVKGGVLVLPETDTVTYLPARYLHSTTTTLAPDPAPASTPTHPALKLVRA